MSMFYGLLHVYMCIRGNNVSSLVTCRPRGGCEEEEVSEHGRGRRSELSKASTQTEGRNDEVRKGLGQEMIGGKRRRLRRERLGTENMELVRKQKGSCPIDSNYHRHGDKSLCVNCSITTVSLPLR